MKLEDLLAESIEGVAVYAIFKTSLIAVHSGKASQAQKELVANFNIVLREYRSKALLQQMRAEAAMIEEHQQQFEKKWGSKAILGWKR